MINLNSRTLSTVFLVTVVFLLFFMLGSNYLFFLSLIDILSVVLCFGIFILASLTYEYVETDFFNFFGITYLVLGGLIALHFISSDHIALLQPDRYRNFQNIGFYALLVQGFSFLLAPLFLKPKKNFVMVCTLYFLSLLILSYFVLYHNIVQDIGVENPLYVLLIIITTMIFVFAGFNIYKIRDNISKNVYVLIIASISINIVFLTVYFFFHNWMHSLNASIYCLSMHFARIMSYFLIIRMIVLSGIRDPIKDLIEESQKKDKQYKSIFNYMSNGLSITKVDLSPEGDYEGYRVVKTNKSFDMNINSQDSIIENHIMNRHSTNLDSIWYEKIKYLNTYKKPISFELYNKTNKKTFSVNIFPMEDLLFGALFNDTSEEHNLEKVKSDFIHTTTHELRTPLMSLKESFNMLMGSWNISKTHLQSHLQDICRRNIIRLSGLVNQVLDYERLDCITEKQDSLININILISSIVDEFSIIAKTKNIRIQTALQNSIPMVYINKEDIICLLNNIVSNAIKYTDRGVVRISSKHDDKHLTIRIADSGCGIPKDKVEKIFEPFTRINNTNSNNKIEGSGLGLSIALKIIKDFDGKIDVKSEVGKGSIFTIKIPNKRAF